MAFAQRVRDVGDLVSVLFHDGSQRELHGVGVRYVCALEVAASVGRAEKGFAEAAVVVVLLQLVQPVREEWLDG